MQIKDKVLHKKTNWSLEFIMYIDRHENEKGRFVDKLIDSELFNA